MRVLVTGASGFIGRHVIRALQQHASCDIVATGRDERRLAALGVESVPMDLGDCDADSFAQFGCPDVIIHLAWPDISSYRDPIHIERHLWDSYRFVVTLAESGLRRVSCVGTCYEYGLQDGCLSEDLPTAPVTTYGVAKDSLRLFLECRLDLEVTEFHWLRPFYTYGEGQQSRALLPQLDLAIERGVEFFAMSGGDQVRDYLEVGDLAVAIVKASLQSEVRGIINVCSGKPVTVRALVEERIARSGSAITPKLGFFPYPDHEPMEFWGDTTRLQRAVAAFDREHAPEA
jgi:dTDP-6-deoxy-L-talose 4-dehydrogenase (NAD+)